MTSGNLDMRRTVGRVLITRPEPDASGTAARLTALGFVPILAPVMSLTFTKLTPPDDLAAILLTSRNAIPACSPFPHDCLVFAVGTATAAAAVQAGFRHVVDADGDAAALAVLVKRSLSPSAGSLFLPTAEGQGTDLALNLRKSGFHVIHKTAYHVTGVDSLPAPALTLLREKRTATAMFFSGATARQFVHLLHVASLGDSVANLQAVSISERAAVALRTLKWRQIKIAARPNQDAMLALMEHD